MVYRSSGGRGYFGVLNEDIAKGLPEIDNGHLLPGA